MSSARLLFCLFVLSASAFAAEKKSDAVVSNAKYDDIALFGRVINFIEKQYVDKVNLDDLKAFAERESSLLDEVAAQVKGAG